ncbi:hypothetical protein [Treponema berlinense]|uniref:hypothetical protein n=1 Tax=Treponema berlinense TaxID=225004 RepID=UPI003FD86C21
MKNEYKTGVLCVSDCSGCLQVRSTGGAVDAVATESAACVFFSVGLCFFYVFCRHLLADNDVFAVFVRLKETPKIKKSDRFIIHRFLEKLCFVFADN